jgi:hypothetical protein
MNCHANGDVAIDHVLTAYERALRLVPQFDARPKITHCTLVNDDLVPLIKAIGAVPALVTSYAYYNPDKFHFYGEALMKRCMAFHTLMDAGVPVAAGSDFDPSPFSPLMGIQGMVTRRLEWRGMESELTNKRGRRRAIPGVIQRFEVARMNTRGHGVGGCFCGAVRFSITAEPIWSAYCHCDSCRRATAAPVAAFVGFAEDGVRFDGDARRIFSSSSGVERSYCANCGTPLSYRSTRWPGEIHLYTPTFDHPEAYPPTFHVHWAEKLSWLVVTDTLPKYERGSTGELK